MPKKRGSKKNSSDITIYLPDESLKKKLGLGKKMKEILTSKAIKDVTAKTRKAVLDQKSSHDMPAIHSRKKKK